jgi:hypothetical protein
MNAGRRYLRDPDFVHRRIVDEVILLPIAQNFGDLESIFTLNEVGARIWELLDGQRSVEDITARIVDEYAVTADAARRDVEEFLEQLERIGAVREGAT